MPSVVATIVLLCLAFLARRFDCGEVLRNQDLVSLFEKVEALADPIIGQPEDSSHGNPEVMAFCGPTSTGHDRLVVSETWFG